MEKFAIGVLLGGIAGALLTANNYKMRTLVKKGQAEAQAKFNELLDKKIDDVDELTEEQTEKKARKAKNA